MRGNAAGGGKKIHSGFRDSTDGREAAVVL